MGNFVLNFLILDINTNYFMHFQLLFLLTLIGNFCDFDTFRKI